MFWYWCKWQFAACDFLNRHKLYGEFVMELIHKNQKGKVIAKRYSS